MTKNNLKTLKSIYANHSKEILSGYQTFLSFQSISTEPEFKPKMERCVKWLKEYVEKIGLECELWPTEGPPVLFAKYQCKEPGRPTLLIYNHYDVQPVDPLEEWISPPFEATIRDGKVYARGAQDNKGQCFFVLQALKLLFEKDGSLPINIKLCIEGEEECGSHGLAKILSERKNELAADYLAVVDLDIKGPNEPSLTLGFRGIVSLEVEMTGSSTDMHSGQHGGIAYNPIHALVETLSKLRDEDGRVTVPGFYDAVEKLPEEELSRLSLTFDEAEYERHFAANPGGGEKEFSPLERNWLRPTIEINGIIGGYTGSGLKTVIPAKALAKLSCRLVARQAPETIAELVSKFIKDNAPSSVKTEVKIHSGGGKAVISKASSELVKAFAKAFEEVFEAPCAYICTGGSIPVITELAQTSGSEIVLLGVGLATDRIHAPNEHFSIERLEQGSLMMARAIELLSTIKQ